jgi:hypothetical protein
MILLIIASFIAYEASKAFKASEAFMTSILHSPAKLTV